MSYGSFAHYIVGNINHDGEQITRMWENAECRSYKFLSEDDEACQLREEEESKHNKGDLEKQGKFNVFCVTGGSRGEGVLVRYCLYESGLIRSNVVVRIPCSREQRPVLLLILADDPILPVQLLQHFWPYFRLRFSHIPHYITSFDSIRVQAEAITKE